MPTKIQLRRGVKTQWEYVNPVLASGEIGYDLTDRNFKIGDGVKTWNQLEYNFPTVTEMNNLLAASDAMIFKGTIGTDGTLQILPTTYQVGWTFKIVTAGTYAGNNLEIGDVLISLVDRSGTGNLDSDWAAVQTNLDGAVTGPLVAVNGNIPVFDGNTGKIIRDSGFTISAADLSNWNTAYGWGNHATVGYLSGVVGAVNGGTGINSYGVGDILFANNNNSLAKLPIGVNNQILAVGPGGFPVWKTNELDVNTLNTFSIAMAIALG
jgi:hypothetical protein